MEITAINSTNHVTPHPSSKSASSKISEKSSLNHLNESNSAGLELNKQKHAPTSSSLSVKNSTPINLNSPSNADTTTILSSLARVTNSTKFKTSDRLSKVIEKCKRLQRLSDQNASKANEDVSVSAIPPAVISKPVAAKSESTKNISPQVQKVTVCKPGLPEELSVLTSHADNESRLSSSSNNSLGVSQNVSESSGASPHNNSETSFKKFLFLFRPSDHEVLVRHRGVNMYRCNVCGGMYRQKFSLKRHFLRSHINFQYISKSDLSNCKIAVPGEFVPQDCEPDSQTTKKFKSSNAVFFENNETRVMPGLYTCNICIGVKFDREHELREHYNKHSEARKKYQCDKCGASFFKKQILSRHLASHGGKIVKKECRRCGSEFVSKDEYQKHMISHSSGRVCKFCSKILSTSANRKRHEALHLGLKPYRCTHCGMCFAQSKDLDRHLRKQHSNVCHFCDKCNKLFPSQASLNVHMLEKHSDNAPKKAESSTCPERPGSKPPASKPEPVKVTLPIKLKICLVCKRSFSTFYAMMKHKSQAHPYYTKRRRNRKTMKQKMAQQAAAQAAGKVSKPSTFPASPVRRGRPPLDKTARFGSQSGRPGSRWMSRREKELAKKEELEFYFSLSEKIAENLLHYVDGKPSQLSLKAYNFSDHNVACNFEERGRFPWSNYNFPAGYDVDMALKARGREVKNDMPENLSNRDKCLYATGLSSVKKLKQMGRDLAKDGQNDLNTCISESVRIQVNGIDMKKLNLEERKKLIGKNVQIVCLCCICGKKCDSNAAFEEHRVNNHQNVDCPCIEIEADDETFPVIPPELCGKQISADGLFFSCNVPPPPSEITLLKCTKCKLDFQSCSELHSHIVNCGNLRSSPSHFWKVRKHKRIKRTMKNRMSSTEQEAAVYALKNNLLTEVIDLSGKKEDSAKMLSEKALKPTEKSQFYKSGRHQAKSFTVGMNYFKTKPVKPPNDQPSKRGRKSYSSLSFRFKNASVQSVTNQCSFCKESFSSPFALNIHLQSHMLAQPKGKELSRNSNDPTAKVLNLDATMQKSVTVQNSLNKVAQTVNLSLFKSETFQNTGSHKNKSLLPDKSVTISPLCLSSESSPILPQELNSSTDPSIIIQKTAKEHNSTEKPVDLSKHVFATKAISPTSKLVNICSPVTPNKSALEIAMAAVQEFSQNMEQNEHISELQKTVEKLTPPSKSLPVEVYSVSPRRPGRPKKVKISSPDLSKKNLFPSTTVSQVVPVPKPISKLEETVKRLAESKAKVDSSLNSPPKIVHINFSTKPFQTPTPARKTSQSTLSPIRNDATKASLPVPPTVGPTSNITLSSTTKFVPILIYSTPNKPVNILGLTPNSTSSSISITPAVPKPSSDESASSNMTKNVGTANSKLASISKTLVTGVSATNKTNSTPSDKKIEEPSPTVSGRMSPSLESIVNSIKQKLHDSPPHEDVAMTWLEDEKFEIPAVPKATLSAQSSGSVQATSTDTPLPIEGNVPPQPVHTATDVVEEDQNINTVTVTVDTVPLKLQPTSKNDIKTNEVELVKVGSSCSDDISPKDSSPSGENKSLPPEHASDTDKPQNGSKQLESEKSLPIDEVLKPVEKVLESEREENVSDQVLTVDSTDMHNKPNKVRKIKRHRKKKHELFTARKNRTVKLKQPENKIEVPLKKRRGRPFKNANKAMKNVPKPVVTQTVEISVDHALLHKKKGRPKKQLKVVQVPDVTIADISQDKGNSCVNQVQLQPLDVIPCQNNSLSNALPQNSNLMLETIDSNKIKAVIDNSIEMCASKSDESPMNSIISMKPKENKKSDLPCSSAKQAIKESLTMPTKVKKVHFEDEVSSSKITEIELPTIVSNAQGSNPSDVRYIQPHDSFADAKDSTLSCYENRTTLDPTAPEIIQQSDHIAADSNVLIAQPSQAKQADSQPNIETPITEFGKSLASRMKEKMRQSFENAAFESLFKPEETNFAERLSSEASLSQGSFFSNNDETEFLRAIKKEFDTSDPSTKHSCPFCLLEFAYLTNFRRHLKVCRSRFLRVEVEPVPSPSSPQQQYLPKKDEVEHSMLNLLRHQSRQTQLLKEAEKTTGSKVDNKFRTYSCKYCHRIYLSLFKLLQHQVTHKLSNLDQSADLDCVKDGENFPSSDTEDKSIVGINMSKMNVDSSSGTPVEGESSYKEAEICGPMTEEGKDVTSIEIHDKFELLDPTCVTNPVAESLKAPDKAAGAYSDVLLNSDKSTKVVKPEKNINKDTGKPKKGRPVGWRKNQCSNAVRSSKGVKSLFTRKNVSIKKRNLKDAVPSETHMLDDPASSNATGSTDKHVEVLDKTASTYSDIPLNSQEPTKEMKPKKGRPVGWRKSLHSNAVKSYKGVKTKSSCTKENDSLKGEVKDAIPSGTHDKFDKLLASTNTTGSTTENVKVVDRAASTSDIPLNSKDTSKEIKPEENNYPKPLKPKKGRPLGWRKSLHSNAVKSNKGVGTRSSCLKENSGPMAQVKDTVPSGIYDKCYELLSSTTVTTAENIKVLDKKLSSHSDIQLNSEESIEDMKPEENSQEAVKRKSGTSVGWKNGISYSAEMSKVVEEVSYKEEEVSDVVTNDLRDAELIDAQVNAYSNNYSKRSIRKLQPMKRNKDYVKRKRGRPIGWRKSQLTSSAESIKAVEGESFIKEEGVIVSITKEEKCIRDNLQKLEKRKRGRPVGWKKNLKRDFKALASETSVKEESIKNPVLGSFQNAAPTDLDELVQSHVPNSNAETIELLSKTVSANSDILINSEETFLDVKPEGSNKREPVKRKRGRPFGWRKHLNAVPMPQQMKPMKNFQGLLKAKSVMPKKKFFNARALQQRGRRFILSKAGSRINKTNRKSKYTPDALQQFEFTPENELPPVPAPLRDYALKLNDKASCSVISSLPPKISKKLFKKSLKRKWLAKKTSVVDFKLVLTKQPKDEGSDSKQFDRSADFEIKDTKVQSNLEKKGNSVSTSNLTLPVKKKLDRPPKSLQATPSTSKFTGFSQSLSTRTFRKTLSRTVVIDACSDSDDEEVEVELQRKKKTLPLKPCPYCKEKFSASLILSRHIQLVHKRRSSQNAKKTSPQSSPSSRKLNAKPLSPLGGNLKKFKNSNIKANTVPADVVESKPSASSEIISLMQSPRSGRSKPAQNKLGNISGQFIGSQSPKKSAKFSSDRLSLVDSKSFGSSPSSDLVIDDEIEIIDSKQNDGIITIIDDETPLKEVANSMSGNAIPSKANFKDTNIKTDLQRKFRKSANISVSNSAETERLASDKNLATKLHSPRTVRKSLPVTDNECVETEGKQSILTTNAKSRRNLKRIAFSSTVVDTSDGDSVQSLPKSDSSLSCNTSRRLKRLKSQLPLDCNSDSDSVKNFSEDSPLSFYRTVAQNRLDAQTSQKFKRIAARVKSSFSSDTDSSKKSRGISTKVIPIHVSDEDSDISIIAVTPATDFYACSICNVNFSRSFHLQKHMRLEHSSDSSSASTKPDAVLSKQLKICPICKVKFATKLSLSTHMKVQHNRRLDPGMVKGSKPKLSGLSLNVKSRSRILANVASRSALSRQCVKPLPTLKRKWSKKDLPS